MHFPEYSQLDERVKQRLASLPHLYAAFPTEKCAAAAADQDSAAAGAPEDTRDWSVVQFLDPITPEHRLRVDGAEYRRMRAFASRNYFVVSNVLAVVRVAARADDAARATFWLDELDGAPGGARTDLPREFRDVDELLQLLSQEISGERGPVEKRHIGLFSNACQTAIARERIHSLVWRAPPLDALGDTLDELLHGIPEDSFDEFPYLSDDSSIGVTEEVLDEFPQDFHPATCARPGISPDGPAHAPPNGHADAPRTPKKPRRALSDSPVSTPLRVLIEGPSGLNVFLEPPEQVLGTSPERQMVLDPRTRARRLPHTGARRPPRTRARRPPRTRAREHPRTRARRLPRTRARRPTTYEDENEVFYDEMGQPILDLFTQSDATEPHVSLWSQ